MVIGVQEQAAVQVDESQNDPRTNPGLVA